MKRVLLLFLVVSSSFLLASCGDNNKQSASSSESHSSTKKEENSFSAKNSSTIKETPTSTETPTSSPSNKVAETTEVDTKNLSEEQVKRWIASIWIKRKNIDPFNDPKFEIILETKEDGLLYASVEATHEQIDTLDSFRINSDGFLEESGYFLSMPDKGWIVVSKNYLDTSLVNVEGQTTSATGENTPSDHERAELVRNLMKQNQGLDEDVLASIPDEEILAANAGNVTNTQVAQTAENLVRIYPELRH